METTFPFCQWRNRHIVWTYSPIPTPESQNTFLSGFTISPPLWWVRTTSDYHPSSLPWLTPLPLRERIRTLPTHTIRPTPFTTPTTKRQTMVSSDVPNVPLGGPSLPESLLHRFRVTSRSRTPPEPSRSAPSGPTSVSLRTRTQCVTTYLDVPDVDTENSLIRH